MSETNMGACAASMPPAVVGHCARTGLPALDLVLLGSGADGHTASLYPGSKQVHNRTKETTASVQFAPDACPHAFGFAARRSLSRTNCGHSNNVLRP
eukprot:2748785-Rhodomonas_salina.1